MLSEIGGFTWLQWRPLYWFGNQGKPLFNPQLSLAYPPVFSNGGRTVTITLKPYRWSNGAPVTSRDVQFWLNLLIANKSSWAGYVPGAFPDNLVSERYMSATKFSLTFNAAYNQHWLLYNELGQITPIPQRAWDKTSSGGTVGNYDLSHSGAVAVYHFLNKESLSLATWATDPLWQVDGPWKISSYSPATGQTALVVNQRYSGVRRGRLTKIEFIPFQSEASEFDALRSGQIDYGYLPVADLSQQGYLASHGFSVHPWIQFAMGYMPFNFTNPTVGPMIHQLYVRQAMQHLINETQYIRDIYHGRAYPTYGPVPEQPASPYLSPQAHHDPYPFSVAAAQQLLSANGWRVRPGQTSTCQHPGTGSHECGAGIAAGTALNFTLQYASGSSSLTAAMETLKSDFSQAGIQIQLQSEPYASLLGNFTCDRATGSGCKWQIENEGLGWSYGPYDPYPTGGEIFAGGAPSNVGGYNNPTNNANIAASHLANGLGSLYRYENFVSQQLPALWVPMPYRQVSVIRDTLHGALPQDPYLNLNPENWYFTHA